MTGTGIIIIITTRHAGWRIGQQRSSSTPVCLWPASGWCPSCGSSSSFPLPQFFARLSSVDHASAFSLGSSESLWWCSWHPYAACAKSSAIVFWWWWSPYSLAGTTLKGWRWFLAKRCVGFSWGLSCERTSLARSCSVIGNRHKRAQLDRGYLQAEYQRSWLVSIRRNAHIKVFAKARDAQVFPLTIHLFVLGLSLQMWVWYSFT